MANYYVQGLVGVRFDPTDQELISYFLHKKAISRELLMEPYDRIMHEFNLLGETEPWVVWKQFGGQYLSNEDLYFFSEVKSLFPKGSRIKRKIASGGTWTQKEPYTEVLDEENGNPIGRKRKLRYMNEGCEHDGMWFLEEYSLADKLDQEASKIVLCRLRKNNRCGKKRNNSIQELTKKPTNVACFENGGDADEEYLFNIDELLGTGSEELPESAETQISLATSRVGADHYGGLKAGNSSGIENICIQPPLEYCSNTYGSNLFPSTSTNEVKEEDHTYHTDQWWRYR